MIKIEDRSIFERDAEDEFNDPLPQKHIDDGRIIYLARNNYGPLTRPTGTIQLVDFDLSIRIKPGQIHTGAIQAERYRAPEVILDAGYTYSADIWSLGVMAGSNRLILIVLLMLMICFDSYGICLKGMLSSTLWFPVSLANTMTKRILVKSWPYSALHPQVFYPGAKELLCSTIVTVRDLVLSMDPPLIPFRNPQGP